MGEARQTRPSKWQRKRKRDSRFRKRGSRTKGKPSFDTEHDGGYSSGGRNNDEMDDNGSEYTCNRRSRRKRRENTKGDDPMHYKISDVQYMLAMMKDSQTFFNRALLVGLLITTTGTVNTAITVTFQAIFPHDEESHFIWLWVLAVFMSIAFTAVYVYTTVGEERLLHQSEYEQAYKDRIAGRRGLEDRSGTVMEECSETDQTHHDDGTDEHSDTSESSELRPRRKSDKSTTCSRLNHLDSHLDSTEFSRKDFTHRARAFETPEHQYEQACQITRRRQVHENTHTSFVVDTCA